MNFFKNISLYFYFKILIFIIFFIIYFPHTLILNEDLNLLSSIETDSGSNLSSIKNLLNSPYYDMNKSFTSSQYGWTWMSINFFLLLPIKILFNLFGINNDQIFLNYSVKIIFYTISLFSVYALFRLSLKILKYDKMITCLIITHLYVITKLNGLFYYIKPETTGLLFFFLSVIFLIDYNKKSKIKFFYLSFCCLFLSILSKQLFLFNSIFFSLFLFYLYISKNKLSLLNSNSFKKIIYQFSKILFLFLLIFFLIHPYAFINPTSFYKAQIYLSSFFYNPNVSYLDSLFKWIKVYYQTLYLFIPFILNIFILLIYCFDKNKDKFYFLLNLVLFLTSILTILIVPIGNQFVFSTNYLVGLLPISFLQIILFLKFILNKKRIIKDVTLIIFILLSSNTLFNNFNYLSKETKIRLNYKNSIQYQLFIFSKENFTVNDRIAVDHFSEAIPRVYDANICHYWRNCGTYDLITKFNPNYVIFSDPFIKYNWDDVNAGENLRRYVKENNMELFKTFSCNNSCQKFSTEYAYPNKVYLKLLLYRSK